MMDTDNIIDAELNEIGPLSTNLTFFIFPIFDNKASLTKNLNT